MHRRRSGAEQEWEGLRRSNGDAFSSWAYELIAEVREISAHELLETQFCPLCRQNEITGNQTVCDNCASYIRISNGIPKEGGMTKEQDTKPDAHVLICKREGCKNPVSSHRGMGTGFCTVMQSNGKTHRQEFLEEKRAENPEYGRWKRGKAERHIPIPSAAEHVEPEPEMEEVVAEEHRAEIVFLGKDEEATLLPQLIDHPEHYGGDTTYEVIKVIEAWGLGFHLGNAVKYIARAGKKTPTPEGVLQDLDKAKWYLDRYIEKIREKFQETETENG